ncbi:hypothetical protein [Flavobacterium sp. 245]|uniref:hypothetical protein n=1 Tax=Flavobacterium sp. 245 TaxID=2512115 RepID=UPI001061125D|nr:hypothetical protein [Flavobacterium sp. 245]TDO94914.1 hypothetical protein EV145_11639 [Flavobacterium sp. 245]
MKFKILLHLFLSLIFVTARGQKQQIKTAFKELRGGFPERALIAISNLDYKILNATDVEKADYFYIKGVSLQMIAERKTEKKTSLASAVKAYEDLLLTEKSTQIFKYSDVVKATLYDIKRKMVKDATRYSKDKNYLESASKFYEIYQLDTEDNIYLYYSALSYLNGKNYSLALKYFVELKKLNYSGKVTSYYAINKSSGKEDKFFSRKDRDESINLGTHEKLSAEMEDPKKENILKNITLIYLLTYSTDNAKQALMDLYVKNTEDRSFSLAELKLYIETKDYLTFKKILIERVAVNPNDAHLYHYLGIISSMLKNKEDMKSYFKKTLEINSSYQFADVEKLTSYSEAIKILNN